MTLETSLQVICSRLAEVIDILIDNRKPYTDENMESIYATKYTIATCKVVKSLIDKAQKKNKQENEVVKLLYFSKFILHGLEETGYYVPCRLELEDSLHVKENFKTCIDMLDRLIEPYNKYD